MKLLLVLILLACASIPAACQEVEDSTVSDSKAGDVLITSVGASGYYMMGGYMKNIAEFVEIWIKEKPLEGKAASFRRKVIESRKNHELNIKGYEKYAFSKTRERFNCVENTYKVMEVIDYDTDGNVLETMKYDNATWRILVPETLGETFFEFACQYKEQD